MYHIGIDARLTYYRTGGISTYIRQVIAALETLDQRNRYTVLHSRKSDHTITDHFTPAYLWTPAHHRLERVMMGLEIARFRFDLLHSPDFIPPRFGAKRYIITVHDLTFFHYPQFLTADARRYYNGQIAQAVHQADHILVDSEATRSDLMAMLDVPADKITVHLLGVDARFRPLSAEECDTWSRQLDLRPGYILFVGTFEPRKNISGLLAAYALLLTRLPDAPALVLAGSRGWLFEETMRLITRMNLQDRIIWRENVDQRSMPALYALARVLVLPSFYEGFGLPALEAMACGTPPIVSNRSSLPEVVGNVGLLIDPDDPETLAKALERAIIDDDWYETQRKQAVSRAEMFTWERTAQIVLDAYRACL